MTILIDVNAYNGSQKKRKKGLKIIKHLSDLPR